MEAADSRELRRIHAETLNPDPLHAEVLRALRPALHCGVCKKPTGALLNVCNVALVCLECYELIERVSAADTLTVTPLDVLTMLQAEDALEEARRTR